MVWPLDSAVHIEVVLANWSWNKQLDQRVS